MDPLWLSYTGVQPSHSSRHRLFYEQCLYGLSHIYYFEVLVKMVIMSPFYVSPYYASFSPIIMCPWEGSYTPPSLPFLFPGQPAWFKGFSPQVQWSVCRFPLLYRAGRFSRLAGFGTWDPLFSKVYFHFYKFIPLFINFPSFHLSIPLLSYLP